MDFGPYAYAYMVAEASERVLVLKHIQSKTFHIIIMLLWLAFMLN